VIYISEESLYEDCASLLLATHFEATYSTFYKCTHGAEATEEARGEDRHSFLVMRVIAAHIERIFRNSKKSFVLPVIQGYEYEK